MRNSNFFEKGLSVKAILFVIGCTATILGAGVNYSIFFGPSLFSPGLKGTKIYRVNFAAPSGNSAQIKAFLSIKNGNGSDVVFEKCRGFQVACIFRNLIKEIEVAWLRPRSLSVSINNVNILSKNEYDPRKGFLEKAFFAKNSNIMEVKIQGYVTSSVSISAKGATINLPPIADFVSSATDYIAPATINFSGLLSKNQDSGYIAEYDWNFGDGEVGSGSLVSHTYVNPGRYTVILTVTDNVGSKASKSQVIEIKANQKPVPIFTILAKTDLGELLVLLDASESYDSDGKILEYSVDWGDQSIVERSTSSGKFEHRYLSPGTYQIVLSLKDDRSASNVSTQVVLVRDQKPPGLVVSSPEESSTVRGNVLRLSIQANEKIKGAEGGISSEVLSPLLVSGDGLNITGEINLTNEGANNIVVKARDLAGNSTEINFLINVEFNKPPLTYFASSEAVSVGTLVNFDASASKDSDGSIAKYIWNFQDGSDTYISVVPKTQHAFMQSGHFNVQLTVIDNEGGTSTFSREIYIDAKPNADFNTKSTGQNLTLEFDASTSSDLESDTLQYSWQFGDGATGNGMKTSHLYGQSGTYEVTLVVSDQYSNVSISKTIVVASDDEEESVDDSVSYGRLIVLDDMDKTFNSTAASVKIKVLDAEFSDLSQRQINIFRNGQLFDKPEVGFTLDTLTIKNLLIEGLNKIEISTVDSQGYVLSINLDIWAGSKNLSIATVAADGSPGVNSFQTRIELIDNRSVYKESSDGNFSYLPKEKFLIIVKDDQGRVGVNYISLDEQSSVGVKLFDAPDVNPIVNEDFKQGLSGWRVFGATPNIVAHIEKDQIANANNDLHVSSASSFRIQKTIKSVSDARMALVRYQIVAKNPDEMVAVVFRGLISGKVEVDVRSLRSFGFEAATSGQMKSPWTESSFLLGTMGEPVDVNILTFVDTNEVPKTSKWNGLFRAFINRARAGIFGLVEITVDGIELKFDCLKELTLIDYTPSPTEIYKKLEDRIKKQTPSGKTPKPVVMPATSLLALGGISVGEIPAAYNGGRNQVAARVIVCEGTTFDRWNLEINIDGASEIIVTKYQSVSQDALTDIVFTIDSATSVRLEEKLKDKKRVQLTVRALTASDVFIGVSKTFINIDKYVKGNYKERFSGRDEQDGGDDWALPWVHPLVGKILDAYPSELLVNDFSNMNGGFTVDHDSHKLGIDVDLRIEKYFFRVGKNISIDTQEVANKTIDVFSPFLSNIQSMFLTYSRPGLEFEDGFSSPKLDQKLWNRIRHECVDGKMLRRILTVEPGHKDHIHLRFSEKIINAEDVGTIDLKVNIKENNNIIFTPEIFKWHGNIQYEVYYEKEFIIPPYKAYKEFVPFNPNGENLGSNFLNVSRVKFKILKIKKSSNGLYSCSQDIKPLDDSIANKIAPKFVYINIRPEGICSGASLSPVLSNIQGFPDEEQVGWIADGVNVENAAVAGSSYLCPDSKISNFSAIYGGPGGVVEIKNSVIDNGSFISGNITVQNSNISSAQIEGVESELGWSPMDKRTMISYADINSLVNDVIDINYEPPIKIYGNVNIVGTEHNRVKVVREFSPTSVLGTDFLTQIPIDSPHLLGFLQEINLTDGVVVKDSILGSTDSSINNYEPIRISQGSNIDSSILYGSLTILGGSNIEKSFLSKLGGASTTISDSTIINSTVGGAGKVVGSTIKNGSALGSVVNGLTAEETPFEVNSASTIDSSFVYGSSVASSTVENKSNVWQSAVINKSLVSKSYISDGSTIDSSVARESSRVYNSSIVANSEIVQSFINGSVVNNSKVTGESTVGSSTVVNSTLNTIYASYSANILNSILIGPLDFSGKSVSSKKCYLNLETPDQYDSVCEPLSLP